MKRVLKTAAICVFLLSGCASKMIPVEETSAGVKHVLRKNYEIGQRLTASVGEPIIKVRDYYVESIQVPVMKPTESVVLSGGLVHMPYSPAKSYPVRGRITVDGIPHLVVAENDQPLDFRGILVREDGTIGKTAVRSSSKDEVVKNIFPIKANPPTAKFEQVVAKKTSVDKGLLNHEILYNGADKNSLRLTYREFTSEGVARTAFYQNLTYDAKSSVIKFKKYRIHIVSADGQKIEYSVIEDQ